MSTGRRGAQQLEAFSRTLGGACQCDERRPGHPFRMIHVCVCECDCAGMQQGRLHSRALRAWTGLDLEIGIP